VPSFTHFSYNCLCSGIGTPEPPNSHGVASEKNRPAILGCRINTIVGMSSFSSTVFFIIGEGVSVII